MPSSIKAKAITLVPLIVFVVVATIFSLGYFTTSIFGIPSSFAFPLPVRLLGLLLLTLGSIFIGWLFRYRKPIDILVSTYITLLKIGRRTRLEERSGRTEPLVITGPYRYVRHPLYFGVVVLVLGWWLLLGYTFLLFSAIFLLLWYNFVLTPFEEKELKAVFGEQYEQYMKEVPRMIPFTKRHRK